MHFTVSEKFSTYDQDNEKWTANSCAEERNAGWWFDWRDSYKRCSRSNVNGLYTMMAHSKNVYDERYLERDAGVQWADFHGSIYSLKRTELKMKPYGTR